MSCENNSKIMVHEFDIRKLQEDVDNLTFLTSHLLRSIQRVEKLIGAEIPEGADV